MYKYFFLQFSVFPLQIKPKNVWHWQKKVFCSRLAVPTSVFGLRLVPTSVLLMYEDVCFVQKGPLMVLFRGPQAHKKKPISIHPGQKYLAS
jgi:hypothetical protein